MISLEALQEKSIDQDENRPEDPAHRHLSHSTTPSTVVTPTSAACTRATHDKSLSSISVTSLTAAGKKPKITSLLSGKSELCSKNHITTLNPPAARSRSEVTRPNESTVLGTKRKTSSPSVVPGSDHQSEPSLPNNQVPVTLPEVHFKCPWGILYLRCPNEQAYKPFGKCASKCQVSDNGTYTNEFDFVNRHVIGEHFIWGDFLILGLSEDRCRKALIAYQKCDKRFSSQPLTNPSCTKYENVVEILFDSQISQSSMVCSHQDKPPLNGKSNRTRVGDRPSVLKQMKKEIEHRYGDDGSTNNRRLLLGMHDGSSKTVGASPTTYPDPWASTLPYIASSSYSDRIHGGKPGQKSQQSTSEPYERVKQQSKKAKTTELQNYSDHEYMHDHAGNPNDKHVELFRKMDEIIPALSIPASFSSPQPSQNESASVAEGQDWVVAASNPLLQGLPMSPESLKYALEELVNCDYTYIRESAEALIKGYLSTQPQ